MFANCQLFGMDLAFPDVCLTPMPAPVPVPYPDIALGPTAIPNALNILFMGMPAHNMATVTNSTNTIGMRIVPSQFKVLMLAP
ncbi:PAAR-like domain-containing protein [Pectobacterium parmentieri]|uniref:PAAR-like domain-containing protein n=1 Tax=Pectobacterium parmentieri TaxID=1905730 RepID=UPI00051A1C1B|nr:PAAR-like domain-containing protein [Pectobacterium parmentieri]